MKLEFWIEFSQNPMFYNLHIFTSHLILGALWKQSDTGADSYSCYEGREGGGREGKKKKETWKERGKKEAKFRK